VPDRSKSGESSVVWPLSTSSVPAEPPPLPVTKACVPGAGVASAPGASGAPLLVVPMGAPRTHLPVVALSPATPAVQPKSVSTSSSRKGRRLPIWIEPVSVCVQPS
jgi:hypothetical protein